MDDLTERFHGLDEMATPDIWPDATTRSPSGPNGPSLGHRLAVICFAAVIAVAASGFLVLAFRPTLGTDQPVGGSNQLPDGSSQITIEQLADKDPTATWNSGDAIREGVPVAVVGPGPEPKGDGASSPRPGSISGFLEVTGFSLDSSALNAVSPEPVALPSDEIIAAVGVEGVVLMAFTGEGAEEWGKMTALQTPTDLRLLDVGARYRIVVVGLGRGDSLFQFAFDVDVLTPEQDSVASLPSPTGLVEVVSVPTAEEIVAGEWPLGNTLAGLLGLPRQEEFQGHCSYFVELHESGSGYCLEPLEELIALEDREVELVVIGEALRGDRVTLEQLERIRATIAEGAGDAA